MGMRLVDANVVVVARQFNPTVANPLWLVRNGMVLEEELTEDCAFTNIFAQVVTKEMGFVLTAEQLQFNPRVPEERKQALVLDKVGRFVELLPHTPFVAAGVNFTYHLIPEKIGIPEFTRSLFFVQEGPLHRVFDTQDARFGGYLSKDVLGCRLKLDVKPFGQLPTDRNANHFVLLTFNFHVDLLEEKEPVEKIKSLLKKWNEALALSLKIMETISAKDSK